MAKFIKEYPESKLIVVSILARQLVFEQMEDGKYRSIATRDPGHPSNEQEFLQMVVDSVRREVREHLRGDQLVIRGQALKRKAMDEMANLPSFVRERLEAKFSSEEHAEFVRRKQHHIEVLTQLESELIDLIIKFGCSLCSVQDIDDEAAADEKKMEEMLSTPPLPPEGISRGDIADMLRGMLQGKLDNVEVHVIDGDSDDSPFSAPPKGHVH